MRKCSSPKCNSIESSNPRDPETRTMGISESNFTNSANNDAVAFHMADGRNAGSSHTMPIADAVAAGTAAADVYDSSNDLMESWGYTATATVLAVNGFLGFTLNISVIVLMCKDMQVYI